MPSWIREQDGIEWYDEAYTTKQTNQKPAQLHKKVDAGKLRCLKDAQGTPRWYARPDVEALREAFLKRSKAAKAWKPSDEQLEARHTREWKEEAKTRRFRGGPFAAHLEKVMLHDIERANAKRKEDEQGG